VNAHAASPTPTRTRSGSGTQVGFFGSVNRSAGTFIGTARGRSRSTFQVSDREPGSCVRSHAYGEYTAPRTSAATATAARSRAADARRRTRRATPISPTDVDVAAA